MTCARCDGEDEVEVRASGISDDGVPYEGVAAISPCPACAHDRWAALSFAARVRLRELVSYGSTSQMLRAETLDELRDAGLARIAGSEIVATEKGRRLDLYVDNDGRRS